MSSYSYEEECGHCGGTLCVFKDSGDMEGNGTQCYDCGRGLTMVETSMTLEELNAEREGADMKPLDKLPYETEKELDSPPYEFECHGCGKPVKFRCVNGSHHFELTP